MTTEKKEKKLITIKIVNLISGLLIIGASLWILLDDAAAIDFFVLMIALSLAILGIARIFVGLGQEDMSKSVRFTKIFSGFVALGVGLAISIIDLRFPAVSIAWLVVLASIALIIVGLSRFYRGIQAKLYPIWYRIFIIVAGVTSIVISILITLTNLNVVPIIPDISLQIILLAYTMIVLAVARISLVFLKKPEKIKEK